MDSYTIANIVKKVTKMPLLTIAKPDGSLNYMPKMTRKSDLPSKLCRTCGKPFAWRKKWERDWDNVVYCSERCRRAK
jgi:hypothetical protein